MKDQLSVLFFSQRFLFPMDTGGKIRTGKLLEQLSKIFEITLVSNVESPKDNRYLEQVPRLCSEFHGVPWKEIAKYSPGFYFHVLTKVFSAYPVTVLTNYSRELEAKLAELVAKKKFDLLICDFLQPSINFKNIKSFPEILFQHNVESWIPKRHAETSRNPFMRAFWRSQWKKMSRYEGKVCREFDGIITVSELDKEILLRDFGAKNVCDIPTGIDTEYFQPEPVKVEKNTLVFTGSMDWLPNEDAIIFFAKEILGLVRKQVPDLKFVVVGRNPSQRLQKIIQGHPEIHLVGWVEDVRPYMSMNELYVIPLRIGGGTRIKAFEAMAMGKAIVSTRIGIEGLPVTDQENVVLADSAEDFADAVVRLLKNQTAREGLEKRALEFVRNNFSWKRSAEVFADFCLSVTRNKATGSKFSEETVSTRNESLAKDR